MKANFVLEPSFRDPTALWHTVVQNTGVTRPCFGRTWHHAVISWAVTFPWDLRVGEGKLKYYLALS